MRIPLSETRKQEHWDSSINNDRESFAEKVSVNR